MATPSLWSEENIVIIIITHIIIFIGANTLSLFPKHSRPAAGFMGFAPELYSLVSPAGAVPPESDDQLYYTQVTVESINISEPFLCIFY